MIVKALRPAQVMLLFLPVRFCMDVSVSCCSGVCFGEQGMETASMEHQMASIFFDKLAASMVGWESTLFRFERTRFERTHVPSWLLAAALCSQAIARRSHRLCRQADRGDVEVPKPPRDLNLTKLRSRGGCIRGGCALKATPLHDDGRLSSDRIWLFRSYRPERWPS